MKFGVNSFVWVSPCTAAAVRELAPKVKGLGFDIFEISCENPELLDIQAVKEELDKNHLEGIICGAFGPYRNICSSDPPRHRQRQDLHPLAGGCCRGPGITGGVRTDVLCRW